LPDKYREGFTRLSERSKPRFSEASMPRFSMRLLLEDNTLLHNMLLHNPRAERPGDYWSTQPVMNKLDGWQSRTSHEVDGPCKKGSPCKGRQNQHAPNVAKTHKVHGCASQSLSAISSLCSQPLPASSFLPVFLSNTGMDNFVVNVCLDTNC
jgi:hypothetical protein